MPTNRLSPTAGTTEAAIVRNVARMLHDLPITDKLTLAYTAGGISLTVAAGGADRYTAGDYVDFLADGSYEVFVVDSVADTALTVEGAQFGSTASNHLNAARFRKNPRFWAIDVQKAANDAVLADLYPDLFAVYEETLTPAATVEEFYEVDAAAEEVLAAYQLGDASAPKERFPLRVSQPFYDASIATTSERLVRIPSLADSNNTIRIIWTRKPAIGDLSEGMLRVVELGAVARLLESKAAEVTQSDKVQQAGWIAPGQLMRDAGFYRAEQERAKRQEKTILDRFFPRRRRNWRGPQHISGDGSFSLMWPDGHALG